MRHRAVALFSRLLKGSGAFLLGAAGLTVLTTSAQATPATTTFTFTGGEQRYSVPSGTTAVTITAVGAPGNSAVGGAGGIGATVTAAVPLSPGTTTLYVEVGGAGGLGLCPAGGVDDGVAGGGFNGGGGTGCGGGGGGASDVRLDSSSTTSLTTADSRLVVAGGGGGGGAGSTCGAAGGTAGDATVTTGAGAGGAGNDDCDGAITGGNGGSGGTAGGSGGGGTPDEPPTGDVGTLGQGGNAPTSTGDGDNFGGGGGGGYYGGGGGGDGFNSGGGGGAGSSFWADDAIVGSTSMAEDSTGVPEVQITPLSPDLSLGDSAPATVVNHRTYSYTVTTSNSGNADATGVTVADTLPTSASLVSVQTTQGACDSNSIGAKKTKTDVISCAIGTVSGGSAVTVVITVTATAKGAVGDAAAVTAANLGADSDDNASASVTVTTH